jgi:hypothetical protein
MAFLRIVVAISVVGTPLPITGHTGNDIPQPVYTSEQVSDQVVAAARYEN